METIYNAVHVTANTVIHIGPCVVRGIIVTGEGAAGDCVVYDGENEKQELKYHIEVASDRTTGKGSGAAVKFNRGIYVVVNAATTHVTIEYKPLDAKDIG